MIYAIIVVLFVVLDQLTKFYIRLVFDLYEKKLVIENFFYITFVENTGAAWSMLEGGRIFFIILTVIMVILMIVFMVKWSNSKWFNIIISLVMAGAIGNLIDRIWIGRVTDFLDFYIFGYDFPVFNVADMCVVVGAFLMAHYILFIEGKKHDNKEISK